MNSLSSHHNVKWDTDESTKVKQGHANVQKSKIRFQLEAVLFSL